MLQHGPLCQLVPIVGLIVKTPNRLTAGGAPKLWNHGLVLGKTSRGTTKPHWVVGDHLAVGDRQADLSAL